MSHVNVFNMSEQTLQELQRLPSDLVADVPPTIAASNVGSPFFTKLPAELRVNIYELVLARDEDDPFETQSTILEEPSRISRDPPKKDSMPPLVYLSRQIRHEASPIFYGTSQFIATCDAGQPYPFPPSEVADWLYDIGKETAAEIKRLDVRFTAQTLGELEIWLWELSPLYGRENYWISGRMPEPTRERFWCVMRLGEYGLEERGVRVLYDGNEAGMRRECGGSWDEEFVQWTPHATSRREKCVNIIPSYTS